MVSESLVACIAKTEVSTQINDTDAKIINEAKYQGENDLWRAELRIVSKDITPKSDIFHQYTESIHHVYIYTLSYKGTPEEFASYKEVSMYYKSKFAEDTYKSHINTIMNIQNIQYKAEDWNGSEQGKDAVYMKISLDDSSSTIQLKYKKD